VAQGLVALGGGGVVVADQIGMLRKIALLLWRSLAGWRCSGGHPRIQADAVVSGRSRAWRSSTTITYWRRRGGTVSAGTSMCRLVSDAFLIFRSVPIGLRGQYFPVAAILGRAEMTGAPSLGRRTDTARGAGHSSGLAFPPPWRQGRAATTTSTGSLDGSVLATLLLAGR